MRGYCHYREERAPVVEEFYLVWVQARNTRVREDGKSSLILILKSLEETKVQIEKLRRKYQIRNSDIERYCFTGSPSAIKWEFGELGYGMQINITDFDFGKRARLFFEIKRMIREYQGKKVGVKGRRMKER